MAAKLACKETAQTVHFCVKRPVSGTEFRDFRGCNRCVAGIPQTMAIRLEAKSPPTMDRLQTELARLYIVCVRPTPS